MKDYIAQYKKIDHLKENISKSTFWSTIHVSDDIICIDKDEITDCWARILTHKIFIHNLAIMVVQVSFYVGFYKYESPESICVWIVVFKVACGASYERQSVIDAIVAAAQ